MYTFLKTLHVLGAATWVGGAVMIQAQSIRVLASRDKGRLVAFLDEQEWLGNRIFAPVAGLTALLGILMVIISDWGFSEAWIIIGIVLMLVTTAMGAGFLTPESVRLKDLVAERGIDDPEATKRIDRIKLVSRVDLAILVLIVADMVVKPSF